MNPDLGGSGGGYPALGSATGKAEEGAAAAGGLGAEGAVGAEGAAGGMALAGRGGEERPAGGKRSGRRRATGGDPPDGPGGAGSAGRPGQGDEPGAGADLISGGDSRRGANAGPGGELERGPQRNAGPERGAGPGSRRRAARVGSNRRDSGVVETLPGMLLETPPRHERAQSGGDGALRVRKNERADRPAQRLGVPPPRRGRRYRGELGRKAVLAGAAVAVVVAALVGWFLAGRAEDAGPNGGAEGIVSAAPQPGALPQTPVATGPAGEVLPGATGLPEGPPTVGSGPGGSSASPGGSAPASAGPGQGIPGATGGTGAPAASGSTDASAAPQGTRLTSKGGSVYATCGGGKAKLTSWQPAQGYSVEKVNQGPGLAAVIVFKGPSDKYRMTVTCVAGTPTPVVLPL